MKYLIAIIFGIVSLNVSAQSPMATPVKACDCAEMKRGESLTYKIKYGWFKIGEAVISTDPDYHYFEGAPHYYVKFTLQTGGILKIFANLNLDFDSYIDAKTFRPYKSKRYTRNGKDENNQLDSFTYADSIYVATYRESRDKTETHAFEETGEAFLDALSTYLYVRAQKLDMQQEKAMQFYIADEIFDLRIVPNGGLLNKRQRHLRSYEIKFPAIEQFPENKTSYAFFNGDNNIPEEIKLSTSDGNFYLILDN